MAKLGIAYSLRRQFRPFSFDVMLLALSIAAAATCLLVGTKMFSLMTGLATIVVVFGGALVCGGLLALRGKGVFLSAALRVLLLMALSGSVAATAVTAVMLANSSTRSNPAHETGDEHERGEVLETLALATTNANEALRRSNATIQTLLEKLEEEKALNAEQERVYAEMMAQNEIERSKMATALEEAFRVTQTPPPAPTLAPQDEQPPPTGGVIGKGIVIPKKQWERVSRTSKAKDYFGINIPFVGPILASMFGGRTRRSVEHIVVTLAEEGRIPGEDELHEIFLASTDSAATRAELDALIQRAVNQDVMTEETAEEVRQQIDEIQNRARQLMSDDVRAAIVIIQQTLDAGRVCEPKDTGAAFVGFATPFQKQQVLKSVLAPEIRACFEKYPPN